MHYTELQVTCYMLLMLPLLAAVAALAALLVRAFGRGR